jgi:hypothetical protein
MFTSTSLRPLLRQPNEEVQNSRPIFPSERWFRKPRTLVSALSRLLSPGEEMKTANCCGLAVQLQHFFALVSSGIRSPETCAAKLVT